MIEKLFFRLSLAYLIGGSMVVAFIAAPLIFQLAPDRNVAGEIAGAVINRYAWTALVATGMTLLSLGIVTKSNEYSRRCIRWLWIVVVVLTIVQLISYSVLRPIMNELIVQIGDFESTPKDNPLRQQFGMLHGLSSLLFLMAMVLGIGALVLESRATWNGKQTE